MRFRLLPIIGLLLSAAAPNTAAIASAADTSPATSAGTKSASSDDPPALERAGSQLSGAGKPAAEPPLLFRRLFVPEARIDDWPRGNVRYLPLDVREFERLIERAERATRRDAPSAEAHVAHAVYDAELDGDELVGGKATLEIRSLAKQPALVSLDPCRLAIDVPEWSLEKLANGGSKGEVTAPATAAQSLSLGVGADGKMSMRVSQSGRLQFAWTLRGQHEAGGSLAFALQLPTSPSNQLLLTLPRDLVPAVDQAIVTELPGVESSGSAGPIRNGESRKSLAMRRWEIELGGQNLAMLRVAKQDLLQERRPLSLVRQSLTYDFSPRGLQLSAELKLDVLAEPVRQIPLYLDWPLTLVTVRYGDTQIPWSEEDAGPSDNGLPQAALDKLRLAFDELGVPYPMRSRHRRIVLQLPEPLRGAGRVLRLGAVAPLPTSGRLPSVRPATRGMLWQEGNATLIVPSPLELNELRTIGCRQTKTEPLSSPARGEAVTLQYFRADADVYVAIRRRPDRFQVHSGTAIDVRGTTIAGRMTVSITAEEGECFSLAADVPASWIIDSVESTPAGGVATWSVDPPAGAAARLNVSLAKAIRVDRPLRLVVTGRWRRTPLGEVLRSDDLRMLRLRDIKAGRRLVAVHAAAPYRLQLLGGENLNRLNLDQLGPADVALLGPAAGGTAFVDDGSAAALSISVGKETPKYSGEMHLDLNVANELLTETYTLNCTPESAEIDHLVVHFSQPGAESLQWTMLDGQQPNPGTAEPIVAQKLPARAQAGFGLSSGELLDLTWRQPRAEPFSIRGTRTVAMGSSTPVSLAAIVQAASQRGSVEVRSVGEHVPEIQNRRLKPATIPAQQTDRWPEVLAAYQYDPQEEAVLSATDPLPSLTISPSKSLADCWVWSVRLDSHYAPGGYSEHVASWQVENTGRSRVRFQLPPATAFRTAWIDGVLVQATVTTNANRESENRRGLSRVARAPSSEAATIDLDLPTGRRFPLVVLKWACDGPPLSIVSSQTVELPEIVDVPVLAYHVNVWLPPNYRLAGGNLGAASADTEVSWSQRLFGPFGRPLGQVPFDPLEARDWQNVVGSLSGGDTAWIQAKRLVQRFSAVAASGDSPAVNDAMTWGDLLTRLQAEAALEANERSPPLLVDRRALADIGIFPRTLIHAPPAPGPDRSVSPLEDADLTLLVAPNALLLTTRSAASHWGGQGSAVSRLACSRVTSGLICEQLQSAAVGGNARFIGVEIWNLPEVRPPWTTAARDSQTVDHAGWTIYHLESFGGNTARIWLVRDDAVAGAGCALFLLSALLTWWKEGPRRKTKAVVAAVATVIALMIPACYAPLGAGLWLGIMCGWTIRLFGIGDRRDAGSPQSRFAQPPRAVAPGVGAILLLLYCAAPHLAKSAETGSSPDVDSRATVYDVLIPTDDRQRPSGKECLVPEPLYDELFRRAGRRAEVAQDWLITSAIYRGRLSRETGQEVSGVGDWTANYDLETFDRQAHVQIPFGGNATNLLPDGVRLDGAPIQFEWKNSGRSLAIEVSQSGQHQLELIFRPTPHAMNSAMVVDLAILPLPNSKFQFDCPGDIPVEIPSAKGQMTRDLASGRVFGSLGSADRLIIRWGDAAALESKPPATDVDELLWLKIRPGSVVLEARFNVRVAEGRLRQVQLLADPRLRRLPLEGGSPIAQIRTETDDVHSIYLGLARPITDQVAFKTSFLLTDTSGIGNLQVPNLDVVGARTVNRQLAVSIELPLELDDKQLGRLKTIPIGDFLAAWGTAEMKPQLAFQLPQSGANPSLAVRSREPQLASSDGLSVSLDRDRLSAVWTSDLSVQGGSIHQLHLSAPRQFNVESAVLRDAGGADVPIRWSRGLLGGVTLFLPGPPAERYKLLVRGAMPMPLGKAVQLPDLRADGCKVESQTILALRKPDVLVTVSDRSGLIEQNAKDSQEAIDHAIGDGLLDRAALTTERFVTCLAGKPSTATVALRIVPNAPRVEGSQTTTMRREEDAWMATVDLDLTVSGGVLDVLRFDLPAQWNGAMDISPTMPSEIIEVPGEGRRQLVLRPVVPITGAQHIRFSGPLTTATGQRVRVPDVRPMGVGRFRRFVRLPTNSNEQQLAWDTRGLKVEELPRSFAPNSPSTEILRTCQVIGETFEATLKSVEKGTDHPRVRLADIRLTSADSQTGYGTAAFDLEPGGTTSCLLDMPTEYRLLHVEVNDAPAVVRQAAPNQWRISGSTAKLPQRIEVVFRVDRAIGDGDTAMHAWRAPSLVGFSVEQTLWSVRGLQSAGTVAPHQEAKSISRLEGEIARMESASAMLESAAGMLANETERQVAQVYAPWARRVLIARATVDQERARASIIGGDRVGDAAIHMVDEVQANLARKLGTRRILADLTAQHTPTSSSAEIWQSSGREDNEVAMYSAAGASGPLTLINAADAADGFGSRMLMALAVASVLAAMFWIAGWPEVREAAARWPRLLGVLAGFCWWLWFAPSVLGWGIVAASLCVGFRPNSRRREGPGSSVIRPSRRSSVVTSSMATQHFSSKPD